MLSKDIKNRYQRWIECVDMVDRKVLEGMSAVDVEDAFYCDLAFGTGGLRGKLGLGSSRMNSYTVGKATQGLANWLNANYNVPTVALCRDTRHGSEEFVRRVASVLAANGIRSYMYRRVEPTPALSFAVRELGCSAGVNITASHNPADYNGYKVYGSDGCQITVDTAEMIQTAIDAVDPFSGVKAISYSEAVDRGLALFTDESIIDKFVLNVASQSTGVDSSGLHIVYTPLHGVGMECVSKALDSVGVSNLSVVKEQIVQDGSFPTCPRPNPEELPALALGLKLCADKHADILLATDPDCDRLGIAVSHKGGPLPLSGNELGLLLLDFLAERALECSEGISKRVACTTIVSAPMADDLARDYGFELRRTLTGFKFIGEQMSVLESEGRGDDFLFGFEESYGYLAGTYTRDKDAVVASVLACELVAHWKQRGHDLFGALRVLYQRYGFWAGASLYWGYEETKGPVSMSDVMRRLREDPPSRLGGLPVEQVVDYSHGLPMPVVNPFCPTPQILPASKVFEFHLCGGSRVIVRPSGTEPKIKAYLFARSTTEVGANAVLAAMTTDMESFLGRR